MKMVPEIGDIVVFTASYVFIVEDGHSVEIPKNTSAKIVAQTFVQPYLMGDECGCDLVIAISLGDEIKYFRINYSVHHPILKVIPASKGTKLLYDKQKQQD